jgi:hypothetical protein
MLLRPLTDMRALALDPLPGILGNEQEKLMSFP